MIVASQCSVQKHFSVYKYFLVYISVIFFSLVAVCSFEFSPASAAISKSLSVTVSPDKFHRITNTSSIRKYSFFHELVKFLGFSRHSVSSISQNPLPVKQIASRTGNQYSNYSTGIISLKPSENTLAHSAGKIPVILVHGTWTNAGSMIDIYKSLDQAGIPAYAATFGRKRNSLVSLFPSVAETAPVAESEKQLADFIAQVEKETGAPKVDLIGHSQGGLLIKDYIAHDTKNDVQAVVDLGATNHGTTFLSPPFKFQPYVNFMSAILGQGATDQSFNSSFIEKLNRTPDTKAGIHYLVLASKNDFMSAPFASTYLKAVPGADVTNQEVHSLPGVQGEVSHLDLPFNSEIINAITQYISTKGEPVHTPNIDSPRETGGISPQVSLLN